MRDKMMDFKLMENDNQNQKQYVKDSIRNEQTSDPNYFWKASLAELKKDPSLFQRCMQQLEYKNHSPEFIKKFSKLYEDAMKGEPTIHTLRPILYEMAKINWNIYKSEVYDLRGDLARTILFALRKNPDVSAATSIDIQNIAGEQYHNLVAAMQEYSNIFHSNTPDKWKKLRCYQNIIEDLINSYITREKEKYINKMIDQFSFMMKFFFELRTDHPFVHKKMVQKQQEAIFHELCRNHNQNIYSFLNEIAQKYSQYADQQTIWKLIENSFAVPSFPDIRQIFPAPSNYDNYKRYEKALKLIN